MRNGWHLRARPVAGGVALISAMLIVALVVLLVDYLLSQQQVMLRLFEMQRARAQADLILDAGINWGRRILQEDARNSTQDHLGEAWAVALAPTPFNDVQAQQDKQPEAMPFFGHKQAAHTALLSGKISDEQARYNLRNLYAPGDSSGNKRSLNPHEVDMLERLFDGLDLPHSLLETLKQALVGNTNTPPFALVTLDDLRNLDGFDAVTLARLEPYVTVLPAPTPLNLNTASAPLIAARLPGFDLTAAQRLLQERERAPFLDLADIVKRFPDRNLQLNPTEISVSTDYFRILGQVQWRELTLGRSALILRTAGNTRILSERLL